MTNYKEVSKPKSLKGFTVGDHITFYGYPFIIGDVFWRTIGKEKVKYAAADLKGTRVLHLGKYSVPLTFLKKI